MLTMAPRPRLALVLGVALLGSALAVPPAAAAGDPKVDVGNCSVVYVCGGVKVPVHKPGSPGAGGKSGSGGGKAPKKSGKPAPCKVERMSPQPPAGSRVWKGNSPGDGAIYWRACDKGALAESAAGTFFAADGEPAPAQEAVDPVDLALEALEKMLLAPPKVVMAPKEDGEGLVGMPVWLAVDKGSKTRFGPQTAQASAGGITVTLTAKVARVVWRLGDGTTLTCTAAQMKPYKKSYGMADSPCGHRYKALPDGAAGGKGTYRVTATAYWDVDWEVEGGGESGELDQTRTAQVSATIREAQAVN